MGAWGYKCKEPLTCTNLSVSASFNLCPGCVTRLILVLAQQLRPLLVRALQANTDPHPTPTPLPAAWRPQEAMQQVRAPVLAGAHGDAPHPEKAENTRL